MKTKVTKKEMKNRFDKIVCVSYCTLQYLLQYENPQYYSTRAEGWACDYYVINNVLISTGYAPLESRNTKKISYDTMRSYDDKAREIVYNYKLGYEEQQKQVSELLEKFIEEVTIK